MSALRPLREYMAQPTTKRFWIGALALQTIALSIVAILLGSAA